MKFIKILVDILKRIYLGLYPPKPEPIIWSQPILIGMEDNESNNIKCSTIQRRLSSLENRFTSVVCVSTNIDRVNGMFLIKFNIIYPFNCSNKKQLSESVLNDVIKSYSEIFDSLEIPYNNLEEFIHVELRAKTLFVAVALNNTGLRKIQKRKAFVELNFDKVIKL